MNRSGLLVILFILLSGTVFSQDRDFGIWTELAVEKALMKNLELQVEGCLRTFNNSRQTDQLYIEARLDYKLNKYLSISGSYRLSEQYENDSQYHIRHKIFLGVEASMERGDFTLSSRLKLHNTRRIYYEEEDEISRYYLRFRLKGSYDIPSLPLKAFVSAELFNRIYPSTDLSIDKIRLSVGAELKLTYRTSLELKYIWQEDRWPYIIYMNIPAIEYKIKF